MSRTPRSIRHPSTGFKGLDEILDALPPDAHAACLVCVMMPLIDGRIADRMLASLRSRVRASQSAISSPVRAAMVQAADLSIAERTKSRRQAVQAALRKAHTTD